MSRTKSRAPARQPAKAVRRARKDMGSPSKLLDYEHCHELQDQVEQLRAAAKLERVALEESVKLQAHYAQLLNIYDGGERIVFASATEWIARLRLVKKLAPGSRPPELAAAPGTK